MKPFLNKPDFTTTCAYRKKDKGINNLPLLNSTEFENNILMFILTSYGTEQGNYLPLMQDLDVILESKR
ncbi:hypothetical protein [Zunongwangia mangrovi]|uniref:hypothetical protein n=1 Tax=Zunongwangia mangrovi TaxID=1334022 RepID=UPI0011145CBF|nr:hypothetical protein [Zunongwangia mangrovi]